MVSLAVIVGGEVEAAHGGTSAVAEACPVLGAEYRVVVAGRCWRGGEAGEGIEEGRDVAVVLSCARGWVDGADADDDDGHHAAFAVFFAVRPVGARAAATAALSAVSAGDTRGAEPEHPEEVERRGGASRSVAAFSSFVAPQRGCYAAVLERLQESVKGAVPRGSLVVFADQRRSSRSSGEREQAGQDICLVLAPPQTLDAAVHVVVVVPDGAPPPRAQGVAQTGQHRQGAAVPSERGRGDGRPRPARIGDVSCGRGGEQAVEVQVEVGHGGDVWQRRAMLVR